MHTLFQRESSILGSPSYGSSTGLVTFTDPVIKKTRANDISIRVGYLMFTCVNVAVLIMLSFWTNKDEYKWIRLKINNGLDNPTALDSSA